jgi:DnaK suppressor protein
MDQAQARALLDGERARLQRLLAAGSGEREPADLGDEVDDADRRDAEHTGAAVDQLLRARWAALQRAEARLAAGNYGRSVRSGRPIPDERLQADPLAELTVAEAAAAERGRVQEPGDAVGLVCRPAIRSRCSPKLRSPRRRSKPARRTTTSPPLSSPRASTSSVTTGPGSRANAGRQHAAHDLATLTGNGRP